jgi:hypothetical protein
VGPLLVFRATESPSLTSPGLKKVELRLGILYVIKYLTTFCLHVFFPCGYQPVSRVINELHPVLGKDAVGLQRRADFGGCRLLCLELFGIRIKVVRQFVPEHHSLRNSAQHPLLLCVHCGCACSDVGVSRTLGEFSLGAVFGRSNVRGNSDAILVAVNFRSCLSDLFVFGQHNPRIFPACRFKR